MRISDQEFNRLRVLKAIRRLGPIARTTLVDSTGLAGGTITELTSDLLRRQIVIEEKSPSSGRGRPRVELRINPAAGYVVGAWLTNSGRLVVEIVNLAGERVYSDSRHLSSTSDTTSSVNLTDMVEQTAQLIDACIVASGLSKSSIHCIGAILPGLLNSEQGLVLWVPTYTTEPIAAAAIIQQRTGLPTVIDNRANVLARAEHWLGASQHVDDFILFNLDLSIGYAHYAAGELVQNSRGMEPAIAHIKMGHLNADTSNLDNRRGPLCFCGEYDCLASYCTPPGIISRICTQRQQPIPALANMRRVLADFINDAKGGDSATQAIFIEAGLMLGTTIGNFINLYNPARVDVVIANPELADIMTPTTLDAINQATLPLLRGKIPVNISVTEKNNYWRGAAVLGLEQIYKASGKLST